jgi:hypothetical protein
MRKSVANSEWVFPVSTKSGHIGQSSLKKRHAKACALAGLEHLPPYTFRHTCLTRWASHMDPYTLAYFAGHSDFGTTRRYVHPNLESGKGAGCTGWAQRKPQTTRCRRLELVRPSGFEPPTFCSGGKRSIQLSYGRTGVFQATFQLYPNGRPPFFTTAPASPPAAEFYGPLRRSDPCLGAARATWFA